MKQVNILSSILSISIILFLQALAISQTCSEIFIPDPNPGSYENFGFSIEVDDNRVIIGYRIPNNIAGKATLYELDSGTWNETELTPSNGVVGDRFGSAVYIDGDRIVVGAPYRNSSAGAVYVYDWDGTDWIESMITASDEADDRFFGTSVACDGDRIVVGVFSDDTNGFNAGSAYIFDYDGTTWQETKIMADVGIPQGLYGTSCAVDADRVIIGGELEASSGTGNVYIYDYDGTDWIETIINASDGVNGDNYGAVVDVLGDRVLVGAEHNDHNGNSGLRSGSSYLYDLSGGVWIETKINASNIQAEDLFGYSVDLDVDRFVIGAPRFLADGDQSAYVFTFDGVSWVEEEIMASDGSDEDGFGSAIAMQGSIVAVGASIKCCPFRAGGAYIFDCCSTEYYADTDMDGFGDPNVSIIDCSGSAPSGYVIKNSDCDDTNANIYPGSTELCDGIDNNCDDIIDEGCSLPPCDDVNLNILVISQDTNRAEINLSSDAIVNSASNILFSAGTDIDLDPPFEVVLGTQFEAIIEPCDNN